MDRPYCEVCGETHAEIFQGEAALCGDCFGNAAREALKEHGLGDFCCRPLIDSRGFYVLCMARLECACEATAAGVDSTMCRLHAAIE